MSYDADSPLALLASFAQIALQAATAGLRQVLISQRAVRVPAVLPACRDAVLVPPGMPWGRLCKAWALS